MISTFGRENDGALSILVIEPTPKQTVPHTSKSSSEKKSLMPVMWLGCVWFGYGCEKSYCVLLAVKKVVLCYEL
jgi:hypothetical protein